MKVKITLALLCICIQSSLFAQNYQQASTRALQILQKYDNSAYQMIQRYEAAPTSYTFGDIKIDLGNFTDFMEYIDGFEEKDIIRSLGTVVHEISHGYTFRMHYQYRQKTNQIGDLTAIYSLIYQNPNQQTLIKHSPTFPSREMVKAFPENLRTPRFSTYISTKEDHQSTQQSGIYGLLDEWNAYYLDTRVAFNLLAYYQNETSKKPEDWLSFMEGVDGVFYAYMEFKLYILKYLIFAQKNHPEIYQGIIQNLAFKQVFRFINQEFGDLIKHYFQTRDKLLKSLKSNGLEVSIDDEFTFIGNHGRGNFMNTYKSIAQELSKTEYQNMLKVLQS